MKKQTLTIAILILSLLLSACGAKTELGKNRDKWDAANIRHYTFELTVSCFCPFMEIMPIVVEVEDGKIVSMRDVNGQPVAGEFSQYIEEAATIEGLFALTEENLSNPDKVEVTYDAQYGFPISIRVDRIEMAMDDEISYYVESFKALP